MAGELGLGDLKGSFQLKAFCDSSEYSSIIQLFVDGLSSIIVIIDVIIINKCDFAKSPTVKSLFLLWSWASS